MFIIDEADLVLSFGYEDDIKKIVQYLPKICQGMLMSATLSAVSCCILDWPLLPISISFAITSFLLRIEVYAIHLDMIIINDLYSIPKSNFVGLVWFVVIRE